MSYVSYSINRIISSVFVLFAASLVIFSIIRLIPGDPARIMLGEHATPEAVAIHQERLGLHLPVWEQYLIWIEGILTFDMGLSFLAGHDIAVLIMVRYPRSMLLAAIAISLALLIAIPLGVLSGTNRNTPLDYATLVFTQSAISIPAFVLGILLIFVFAAQWNILPSSGYVSPLEDFTGFVRHVTLPAITLGLVRGAFLTRFVRSEMLEELSKDYALTARAYGHRAKTIHRKYVVKNALMPVITVAGIQFGGLIAGLVIIEQVFTYPGMGVLILDAIHDRDYPVLQASLLIIAATFILINLIVDLLYGLLNPKIRY